MSPQAVATFAVLLAAVTAIILGRWSPDIVALGVLLVLTISGLVTVQQGFGGFGTPTIAA